MANPVTRTSMFLDAIAKGDPNLLPQAITRDERFLRALSTGEEITPTTYDEFFLQAAIAFKGGGTPSNLFDGSFVFDYYVSSGFSIFRSDVEDGFSGSSGIVIAVTPGEEFLVRRIALGSRFRTMFLNKEPVYNNTNQNIGVSNAVDHGVITHTILSAPQTATHLFIQVSNSGETPETEIIKL